MKNTQLLFICSLLVTSIVSAAGPEYRDFLIAQQPMPDILLLKQDLVSVETHLEYKNNISSSAKLSHKKTLLDMSPAFITNKPKSFSVFGLGYMRDDFGSLNGSLNSTILASYYSGVYTSIFAISELHSSWFLSGYLSYGIFSENNINRSYKSGKIFSIASLAYKKNSRQVYKLGILYNSNFGQEIILPTLGVTYSRNSYVLDALIPLYISLRKVHSKKWHSILKAELSYASYYDQNQNDILEISGSEVGFSVEYNVYRLVWLQAGGSYVGETQLSWLKENNNFASIDNGYKFAGGVNIRF